MIFDEKALSGLRDKVAARLSGTRMAHTLGVERAAEKIGKSILGDRVGELRAAAILHDVTKELKVERQLELARAAGLTLTPSDLACEQIYHSFTAPTVIKSDFPEFYTEDIASAVYNHTTGAPGMSLFDEIILLSDCIEDGRRYESATRVREKLYAMLDSDAGYEEKLTALHIATLGAFDATLGILIEKNRFIHEKTVASRNWVLTLIGERSR